MSSFHWLSIRSQHSDALTFSAGHCVRHLTPACIFHFPLAYSALNSPRQINHILYTLFCILDLLLLCAAPCSWVAHWKRHRVWVSSAKILCPLANHFGHETSLIKCLRKQKLNFFDISILDRIKKKMQ